MSRYKIKYNYGDIDFTELSSITKLAVVIKDLDEKMHSSSDYVDLKSLTMNWITRSDIASNINKLYELGFTVFITTDHGNIAARGWRRLKDREKLGVNKSGSRSARHIEYSSKETADDFIYANPEMSQFIVREENVLYLKNDLSFKKEKELVTHGGSHILEVAIPFIKITK